MREAIDSRSTSPDVNARIAASRARPARRSRPDPRRAGGQERRQPLDALAGRAGREQPHRGGAGQDRHRARRAARRPVRRRRVSRPIRCPGRAIATPWRDPQSGYVRRNISPAGLPVADPDRRGRAARGRASRVRNRRARRDHPPADLGAAGKDRSDGRQGHPSPRGRRLSRHATRRADGVPQPHAQAGALRRGARQRSCARRATA